MTAATEAAMDPSPTNPLNNRILMEERLQVNFVHRHPDPVLNWMLTTVKAARDAVFNLVETEDPVTLQQHSTTFLRVLTCYAYEAKAYVEDLQAEQACLKGTQARLKRIVRRLLDEESTRIDLLEETQQALVQAMGRLAELHHALEAARNTIPAPATPDQLVRYEIAYLENCLADPSGKAMAWNRVDLETRLDRAQARLKEMEVA